MIDRRGLIVGSLTMFAAPAIVRASNLMDLRGYIMDPKVMLYVLEEDLAYVSFFHDHGHGMTAVEWMGKHSINSYRWVRASELGLDAASFLLGGTRVPRHLVLSGG